MKDGPRVMLEWCLGIRHMNTLQDAGTKLLADPIVEIIRSYEHGHLCYAVCIEGTDYWIDEKDTFEEARDFCHALGLRVKK